MLFSNIYILSLGSCKLMVKAIIFDIWGTLIETGVHPSPSKQVKYFLRDRRHFSEFIINFEEVFLTKEFDSLKEGFEEVVDEFKLNIPEFVYDKLIGMWNKNNILAKEYEETFMALEALKKNGYKLFVLANLDKFSHEQLEQKFELSKYFDKMYLSYQTGFLKSNEDSFKQILKENKLKKEDVVMIGDSIASDIKGAENAGVKAILVDRRDSREFDPKILNLTQIEETL